MNIEKIKSALQDLIIRLQDAEEGYLKLADNTDLQPLKKHLLEYANERHKMHQKLEQQVTLLGGDAEVKTSFLGDLHRMFIGIKLNTLGDNIDSIVTEIERGSNKLLDDYAKVMSEVKLSDNLLAILSSQKVLIESEIMDLKAMKEAVQTVA